MLVNRARLSSNVRQFDETELPPRDSHGFPNFRKHAFHHLHIYVIRRDEREREREREGREKACVCEVCLKEEVFNQRHERH